MGSQSRIVIAGRWKSKCKDSKVRNRASEKERPECTRPSEPLEARSVPAPHPGRAWTQSAGTEGTLWGE